MRKAMLSAAILALLIAPAAAAQTPAEHPHSMTMGAGPNPMDCAAMMAKQKEMMANMDDMDARLQTLVDTMNKARGSKKTEAMAAVINELVTQRKTIRDMAMKMQPMMMQHMAEHMHQAMMGAMQAMEGCPMMKGMAPAAKQ